MEGRRTVCGSSEGEESAWDSVRVDPPFVRSVADLACKQQQQQQSRDATATISSDWLMDANDEHHRNTATNFSGAEKCVEQEVKKHGYDRTFLRRLARIVKICAVGSKDLRIPFPWVGENCYKRGWKLGIWYGIVVLITTVILQNYVTSYTGVILGSFNDSIFYRKKEEFMHSLVIGAFQIFISGVLDAAMKFIIELFSWQFRATLCKFIHLRYFYKSSFYLSLFNLDNPDQMITQDVENFADVFTSILSNCMMGPVLIMYYTYITATSISFYAPIIIYTYFFVGLLLNKLIMNPTVQAVFQQEQFEGEFRYAHARVRSFAEPIATYRGNKTEQSFMDLYLTRLLYNKARIMWLHLGLNISTNSVSYLVSLIPYIILAIPVFTSDKQITIADLSANVFYCIQLVYGFSQFINASEKLSNLAGYTHRIGLLLETLDNLEHQVETSEKKMDDKGKSNAEDVTDEEEQLVSMPMNDKIETMVGDCWQLKNVSFKTPDARIMDRQVTEYPLISLTLKGCGKSTILRILHGLWSVELRGIMISGNIIRPPDSDVMFIPQKPYLLFMATLKEQIVYPHTLTDENCISDEQLSELLEFVNLSRLLQEEFSTRINWISLLSPGEVTLLIPKSENNQEQLLSFARLFYHRPSFAALDEATSALSEELEEKMYKKCIDLGISFISVGHRESLRKYHTQQFIYVQNQFMNSNEVMS